MLPKAASNARVDNDAERETLFFMMQLQFLNQIDNIGGEPLPGAASIRFAAVQHDSLRNKTLPCVAPAESIHEHDSHELRQHR